MTYIKILSRKRYVNKKYASLTLCTKESDELRKNFKDGQVLGRENFLTTVGHQVLVQQTDLLPLEAIFKGVCTEFKIPKNFVTSQSKSQNASLARAMSSKLAINKAKILINSITKLLNRDACTISSLLYRFCNKHDSYPNLQLQIARIKQEAVRIAELNV